MKRKVKIFLLFLLPFAALAQDEKNYEDSLQSALERAANDTIRLELNRKLGFFYQDSNPRKALPYHEAQLALAQKLNLQLWEADALEQIAYCHVSWSQTEFADAYKNYISALKIVENPNSAKNGFGFANFSYSKSPEDARLAIMGMVHFELGSFYNRTRYYKESLEQYYKAVEIGERIQNKKILSLANRDIGRTFLLNNQLDSGIIYLRKSEESYQNSPYQRNLGTLYLMIGNYYLQKQQPDSSKLILQHAIAISQDPASIGLIGYLNQALGVVFSQTGELDSALYYTFAGQKISDSLHNLQAVSVGFTQLGNIYKLKNDYATAYDYLLKGKNLGDSLNNDYINKTMQFLNLVFDQKIRLQELEKEQQESKSRNRMVALLTGLGIFLLVAILLYRNNRQKQKANKVLEKTLSDLKSTQKQLVHSEKMASLGELTAGIAHEIQNPLNFVNNFSEINSELLDELQTAINANDSKEIKSIIHDIKDNENKIAQHGKRADGIVKGMLQHSRASTGQKEPTDINTICDEYLRLAYHGLRAKDKSFNANLQTDFDNSLEKINIVPQEIGRVILNLLTNAFYAVTEKKKSCEQSSISYEPTVSIKTKRVNDKIEIIVSDNGNGIPDDVKEKIFQPFFTTKPTGQGTGLGLSMSYDIITKGHKGTLQLESEIGKGTSFSIILPNKS